MFGKDLLIKKYPYLAYSTNLMEYFAIIGYQENMVPKIVDSVKKDNNIYSPKILSSINSSSDYGMVDNSLIIRQIYPENPLPILINKNEQQEPPAKSNVIYSLCFDSQDGKEKLFHVCFGYKFYEKYKYYLAENVFKEYYIPKSFCIISQYYYFTFFEYLCKKIHFLISQPITNSFPIEIIIYNIINFIPSPMNYRLHLDLFSYTLDAPKVEIGQLSGYPYLDFDLSEIFNLLPLNLVIEIFVFTMLEQSMLFFSSNLELLNMVMFIMFILNYPCNDSTYFWHIASVSESNLCGENKFVGKLMVSLLGVNCTYNDDIDSSPFGKYHFIVDIDNKKMIFKEAGELSEDDEINEVQILSNFQNYIQNIIKDKDKNNDNSFLKDFIIRLRKTLEFILTKNAEFSNSPKNKYVNFFKMSNEIMETNRKIQEIFYDFCLNILMIFYQDNTLNSSFDKIKKDDIEETFKKINKLRNTEENKEMNNEEKIFCHLFRNAVKYKIYFENFIQSLESMDVFKIPLLFSREFINLKLKDHSNKLMNKIQLFDIIDSLYYPNNKQQTINITLNNIFSDYSEKMKKYFKHFFTPERLKLLNSRQLVVLNRKIINKYIYLLNNIYEKEDLMDLFPSIRIQEDEGITLINRRLIITKIQKNMEQKNLIELPYYLLYALIYVFSISISFHSYSKMITYITYIIKSLGRLKYFMEQYTYIIIKTFYKYYLIHKEKNIYPEINISNIKMYYYMLVNFLKENLIIPNEEIMAILSKFFNKIIYQERESLIKIKEKEVNYEAYFKIEKDKNFFCIMKHCFTSKNTFKPFTMIKAAMKENNNCNIVIRAGKKQIQPTINIKIKDYVYTSEFFAPKKIFKVSQKTFNDFFDASDLDMSKLKIKNVRDVITNLIQYGLVLNQEKDFLPVDFLVYTLYLMKDLEEKNNK